MIDTIKISLSGITENILNKCKGADFAETIFAKSAMENLPVHIYYKTFPSGTERAVFFKGKINIPSSDYNVNFMLRGGTDEMEIEFSLPKLLYGNNILQLIDKSLLTTDNCKQSYQATRIFGMLRKFLRIFTNVIYSKDETFYNSNENYLHLVELKRIDICFNQLFQSEKDARDYLNYQKRIRKKYMNEKTKYKADWNNSIYIVNQDYTFKIYHKGDEFRKHDKPKLKVGEITNKLEKLSDKMLRYEMEFRSKYMSKIFMNRVYFPKNEKHIYYKKVRKLFYNLERNKDKIILMKEYKGKKVTSPEKLYKYICEQTKKEFIENNQNNYGNIESINEWYKKEEKKVRKFIFDKSLRLPEFKVTNDGEIGIPTNLYFEPNMFIEMAKKFRTIYKEFQIDNTNSFSDINKKITDFNARVQVNRKYGIGKESAINKNKLNVVFHLLKTYSWKEIENLKMFSREQIWRHKKRIKELGLNENGQMISHKIHRFDDYKEYIEQINFNFGFHPCNFYYE